MSICKLFTDKRFVPLSGKMIQNQNLFSACFRIIDKNILIYQVNRPSKENRVYLRVYDTILPLIDHANLIDWLK